MKALGSQMVLRNRVHRWRAKIAAIKAPIEHPDVFETRVAITAFLFLKDTPAPVDFAFVLDSPTLSSVEPAIDLYLRNLTSKIVISGFGPKQNSDPAKRSEAEAYKAHAIDRGVPGNDIIVETNATNTKENFVFSHPIIEKFFGWSNVRSVSISGKPFHMRRALMAARAHWPSHLKLLMIPSNAPEDAPAETWWQTEHGRNFVLTELQSIGVYALAGDIGGF